MSSDLSISAYVWAHGTDLTSADAIRIFEETGLSSMASSIAPGKPHGLGAGPGGAEVVYVQLLVEGLHFAGDHFASGAATAAGAGVFTLIVSGLKRIRKGTQRRGAILVVSLRFRFDDGNVLYVQVPDDDQALQALSETILPRLEGSNRLLALSWNHRAKRWRLEPMDTTQPHRWERFLQWFRRRHM